MELASARSHKEATHEPPARPQRPARACAPSARQADLAAARYSVTTWEDNQHNQRFRVQAVASKARRRGVGGQADRGDRVLAGSFSMLAVDR